MKKRELPIRHLCLQYQLALNFFPLINELLKGITLLITIKAKKKKKTSEEAKEL